MKIKVCPIRRQSQFSPTTAASLLVWYFFSFPLCVNCFIFPWIYFFTLHIRGLVIYSDIVVILMSGPSKRFSMEIVFSGWQLYSWLNSFTQISWIKIYCLDAHLLHNFLQALSILVVKCKALFILVNGSWYSYCLWLRHIRLSSTYSQPPRIICPLFF